MAIDEVRETLAAVRAACTVVPVTVETHEAGLALAEQHRLPVYDAMILASASLAGCRVLLSQDFSDGQRFERVVVRNPFR
jgi:predicted nucleic acid-binding protein